MNAAGKKRSRDARTVRRQNWKGRQATADRWDRMVNSAEEDIRRGMEAAKPPRILTEEASWKRAVYRFVIQNFQSKPEIYSLERYVEQLIAGNVNKLLPNSPTFQDNPFHWVFSALSADHTWTLTRQQVFRFGRQLNYARQHRVPEEFLIGFLWQAGKPSDVEKKAGEEAIELGMGSWISSLPDRHEGV